MFRPNPNSFSGFVLLFVILFLSAYSQCPCPNQTNCQIVANAHAIIQAKITAQSLGSTTTTFSAVVKKSFKGSFTSNQQISFSADSDCVKMKIGKTYVLGLTSQASGWWLDDCSIHSPRGLIPSDLWQTIKNYQGKCGSQIVCYDESGNVHQNGSRWTVNACKTCSCVNGMTNCVSMICPPLSCNNSYTPQGQCCPVCPQSVGQCTSDGMIYNDGAEWYPSVCRRCTCDDGETQCQNIQCPTVNCDNAYTPSGQCCPVCPQPTGQCYFEGSYYNHGQSWNPTPCRSCRCNDHVTTCVTTVCGQLPCNNSYTPQGQCCPVCPAGNCYWAGQSYYDGQIWKPDYCSNSLQCQCSDGYLRCTFYNCAVPTCSNWYFPQGQCCPVCR